jgi:hypothetical protein
MPPSRPGASTTQHLLAALALLALTGCVGAVGKLDAPSDARPRRDSPSADGRGTGAPDAREAVGLAPDGPPDAVAASPLVRIDPAGRTFLGVQQVKLAGGLPGSTIHYTIDGSLPTRSSKVYSAPFTLTASALVRAIAEGPGPPAGERPVSAAVFVQVAEELSGWSSNLPVVVLHTHTTGALPVVREGPRLPGSITVLDPADGLGGRAWLVGWPSLLSRAGLRLRGESSLQFPQKSYGVELWAAGADQDSDQMLLGLPADSDFALVGPGYTDRSFVRNALAYALSNQIGRYASRTRFVEVFVVEGGATVARSDYRGLYTLAENIKRGPARVNVAKLEATDQRDPAVTGGYSLRIDKGPSHFSFGPIPFQFVYPPWEEIGLPGWTAQRSYLQGFMTEFLEALSQPGYRHPRTGKPYTAYIDVPSFVDHNLMTVLFKNVDGLRLSAYLHKNRGGPLVAGPVWDFDRSSGTPFDGDFSRIPRAAEPKEWAIGDGTHPLQWGFWGHLLADPTFKAAHARRWAELSRGPFSVDNIHRLIDRFAAELNEAQARHFARWTDLPPTGGAHAAEIKLLKDWFAARIPWVTSQLPPIN